VLFFLLACVRHDTTATLNAAEDAAYPGLRPEVLSAALTSYRCAKKEGFGKQRTLTIIDFELPSTEKRLWVIGLAKGELLFHDYVSHGKNTGEDLATDFSNVVDSRQSSLGMFVTAETYTGKNGLSLRLDGLESGVNDAARERYIVLHGADYVSKAHIEEFGRLGRSWGCPAVPLEITESLINRIDRGTLLFTWYPDSDWLEESRFLNCQ
jgi:hypothetical protein